MITTTIKVPSQGCTVVTRSHFESILEISSVWLARARQRQHLAELTRSQLDDVGISMKAAEAEAGKPFWRA